MAVIKKKAAETVKPPFIDFDEIAKHLRDYLTFVEDETSVGKVKAVASLLGVVVAMAPVMEDEDAAERTEVPAAVFSALSGRQRLIALALMLKAAGQDMNERAGASGDR